MIFNSRLFCITSIHPNIRKAENCKSNFIFTKSCFLVCVTLLIHDLLNLGCFIYYFIFIQFYRDFLFLVIELFKPYTKLNSVMVVYVLFFKVPC